MTHGLAIAVVAVVAVLLAPHAGAEQQAGEILFADSRPLAIAPDEPGPWSVAVVNIGASEVELSLRLVDAEGLAIDDPSARRIGPGASETFTLRREGALGGEPLLVAHASNGFASRAVVLAEDGRPDPMLPPKIQRSVSVSAWGHRDAWVVQDLPGVSIDDVPGEVGECSDGGVPTAGSRVARLAGPEGLLAGACVRSSGGTSTQLVIGPLSEPGTYSGEVDLTDDDESAALVLDVDVRHTIVLPLIAMLAVLAAAAALGSLFVDRIQQRNSLAYRLSNVRASAQRDYARTVRELAESLSGTDVSGTTRVSDESASLVLDLRCISFLESYDEAPSADMRKRLLADGDEWKSRVGDLAGKISDHYECLRACGDLVHEIRSRPSGERLASSPVIRAVPTTESGVATVPELEARTQHVEDLFATIRQIRELQGRIDALDDRSMQQALIDQLARCEIGELDAMRKQVADAERLTATATTVLRPAPPSSPGDAPAPLAPPAANGSAKRSSGLVGGAILVGLLILVSLVMVAGPSDVSGPPPSSSLVTSTTATIRPPSTTSSTRVPGSAYPVEGVSSQPYAPPRGPLWIGAVAGMLVLVGAVVLWGRRVRPVVGQWLSAGLDTHRQRRRRPLGSPDGYRRRLVRLERGLVLTGLILVLASGISVQYFANPTFGTFGDYLGLVAWGFGFGSAVSVSRSLVPRVASTD